MDILRLALALFIVFGLLGGLYFISNRAKRLSWLPGVTPISFSSLAKKQKSGHGPLPDDEIRVVKRVHLTASHQLHFIALNGRRLLLCTHPQGCEVLPIPQSERTDLIQQANQAPTEGEQDAE
jgi:hypothetical protein